MYRVITCLTTQHDYRLLALAILICVAECFVSLYVYGQVGGGNRKHDRIWLTLAGLCLGSSIWATHFIGMLAYEDGVAKAYEPALTAVSFAIAVAMSSAGLALCASGRGRLAIGAGGVVIGAGIMTMHFTGMHALILAGDVAWDMTLAAASIALGLAFSAAAMLVFHATSGMLALLSGTGLLTLGIGALHFIAMAAVTIVPDASLAVPESRFSDPALALIIALTTVGVLGAGFVAGYRESRRARSTARLVEELANASTDALVIARDGIVAEVNRRAEELWGREGGELVGRRVFGDLLAGAPSRDMDEVFTFETELLAADGRAIAVEILRQPIHSAPSGNEVYAITDLRPLIKTTERLMGINKELLAREAEVRQQNMRFDTALSNMLQGLCMFDAERRLVVCNRRYAELYRLDFDRLTPGTPLSDIIEMRIAAGVFAGENPDAYRAERALSAASDIDMVQQLNDGRSIAISLRTMPNGGYVSTHEDVTERRRMEDRLVHMAHHDPLTDLPNRLLLREQIEKAVKGMRRNDGYLAVMMLDLDRFKEVNDSLGHMAGDALLKAVAERLTKGLRKSATVARFGGDEFAIVEQFLPKDDPEVLPKRIRELIAEPVDIDGHIVNIGTSIGIAIAPQDGMDAEQLLRRADHALYRAKSEMRGGHRFFEPRMAAQIQERRALEKELQEAIVAGQFELFYQPLVNLKQNRVCGYESLLRWRHPTRGIVSPGVFIPVLEETGMINGLTEWLLREACRECAGWPGQMKVAVNLSVPQFKARNLIPVVRGLLAETGLEPHRLELEITESVMLTDSDSVFDIFRQIRDLGVRIVLDDFGTGFSSLSYLLRFPFDKIKIDRSFISGLPDAGNSLVLVRSLLQMANGLGLGVTAEGIETLEQLDIMRAEGATEVQGYLVSKPRPASEITHLLPPSLGLPETAVA